MSKEGFAFQRQGAEHLAGHDTYSARVGKSGHLSFSPQRIKRRRVKGTSRWIEELIAGIPLTLRTVDISSGDRKLTLRPEPAVIDPGGVLVRNLGPAQERLEGSELGLRQTWIFATAPQGKGALTLKLKVSGLPHAGKTPGGLHFLAAEDGMGARHGRVEWVSDSSERIPVFSAFSAGEIRIIVPPGVLKKSAYPASLTLLISPQQGMDRPISSPMDANQEEPAVAFDGTGYLVVWRDGRARTRNDIYGSRVSAAGKVLDPGGFRVRRGGTSCDRPALAMGKDHFLVVWEEHGGGSGFDIMAARVSRAGTVLDPDGIVISRAPHSQSRPKVSFDGTRFWVVWEDRRGGRRYDIYGARVSAAGKVLDPAGVPISAAEGHQKFPALCHGKAGAMVVWGDLRSGTSNDIYGARLDAEKAKVLDPAGIPISIGSSSKRLPVVGCDGDDFLVLWEDASAVGGAEIQGARLDRTGKVLGGGHFPVSGGPDVQEHPGLAPHESGYLAVWQDRRAGALADIHMSLIGDSGGAVTVKDPGGNAVSNAQGRQERPVLAAGSDGFLVVWLDHRHGTSFDIFGARISAKGALLEERGIPISSAARIQVRPRLASNGERHMAVWRDHRGDSQGDIFGARIISGGGAVKALDPGVVSLSRAPGPQGEAALAAGGGNFLVVWQDRKADPGGEIMAVRYSGATGELLDQAPIKVSTGQQPAGAPSVAHNGERFLVVWESAGAVRAARVNAQGEVMDGGALTLSLAAKRAGSPRVAGSAGRFLVVWQSRKGDRQGDILGARVSGGDGKVMDPRGLPVSKAPGPQRSPAVCSAGGNFWVAWQDERPGGQGADIYGARVRAKDGKVLDLTGVPLGVAVGAQQHPALAWDGQRTLVVWQDLRLGKSADIMGTLVDGEGRVIHPQGLILSDDKQSELTPALSSTRPWSFLLAYHQLEEEGMSGAHQLRVRRVDWQPQGGACTADSQCQAGRCKAGACGP